MKALVVMFVLLFSIPAWASVDLDGTDDWIGCGSGSSIDGFNQVSFFAWIYIDSIPTSDSRCIVSKLLWDPNYDGWEFSVFANASDQLYLRLWYIPEPAGGNNQWKTADNTLSLNTWHHVGFTYDRTAAPGTNDPVFYIDGQESADSIVSDSGKASSSDAAADFNLGKRGKSGHLNDQYWDGKIEEIGYWNVELTATQVSQLYSASMRRMVQQIQASNLPLSLALDEVADGSSADGVTFVDLTGTNTCTGDDGANNTGLTGAAGEVLSYP